MNPPRRNRLALEKSPYLQQHADNPVDWWPWGPEALAEAKAQDKPIFLSIGYSTCHWCHVMAHESFEDPKVADLMNDLFINIKVDREERPDIDAIYMSAVQALSGSGGWPMSVWLTPDLKPFFGGTYFPPDNRYGRAAFSTVIIQLGELYEKDRPRILEAANDVMSHMTHAATAAFQKAGKLPAAREVMELTFASLSASFDAERGGFSPAPKFPMPVYLDYLLYHYGRTEEARALDMAATSVRHMAEGGLYDQLGGGFSRYSTDERWLVPHFEKMLYDNAQLLSVCAQLAVATGDDFFGKIALETAAYMKRDLGHSGGAFYSAEDADSEGKEGTFYLWTFAELKRALGEDADEAARVYGVTVNGNFMDPHTREAGMNVLSRVQPPASEAQLSALRKRMFDHRLKRPRPHRDEKILTEWNGLAIGALARAGLLLNEPGLVADAARAAAFLQENLYDAGTKKLFRRWRDGARAIDAQLTDHAMLIEGLLNLFEVSGDARWLRFALDLQQAQDALFFDTENGGYFMNGPADDLVVRIKDDGDNVIPSGNSVAVMNGLRLTALTGRPEFREKALATLRLFASSLTDRSYAVAKMVPALDWEQTGHDQVIVVGSAEDGEPLRAALRQPARRPRQVLFLEPGRQEELAELLPHLPQPDPGKAAAAYICRNFACQAPIEDAGVLVSHL